MKYYYTTKEKYEKYNDWFSSLTDKGYKLTGYKDGLLFITDNPDELRKELQKIIGTDFVLEQAEL